MKVVTLGEIMLRLSPLSSKRFIQADLYEAQYGGAEANVAVALANWGERVCFVSKVPKNEIGEGAVGALRKYGVQTDFVVRGGERMGLYFLEKGAAQRPSKVIYDRKGSAFALSEKSEYDWNAIFAGADWFHVTGITPALGEGAEGIAQKACEAAKKSGTAVSFDINYRSSLWSKDRAEKVLDKILGNVDVCITNASQMRDFYGIAEQGGGCGCVHAAAYLKERYGIGHTAFTYRETDKAGRESIYACVSDGKSEWISDRYAVGTIGRIGGGDAFAAGQIYKLRQGAGGQEAINFAAAARVGGREFSTLAAALEAAHENAEIVLLADIAEEELAVGKSVTITNGGKAVNILKIGDGNIFNVSEGVTMPINLQKGSVSMFPWASGNIRWRANWNMDIIRFGW